MRFLLIFFISTVVISSSAQDTYDEAMPVFHHWAVLESVEIEVGEFTDSPLSAAEGADFWGSFVANTPDMEISLDLILAIELFDSDLQSVECSGLLADECHIWEGLFVGEQYYFSCTFPLGEELPGIVNLAVMDHIDFCAGDLNDDFIASATDILIFLSAISVAGKLDQDYNEDVLVNAQDLLLFLIAFNQGCN